MKVTPPLAAAWMQVALLPPTPAPFRNEHRVSNDPSNQLRTGDQTEASARACAPGRLGLRAASEREPMALFGAMSLEELIG